MRLELSGSRSVGSVNLNVRTVCRRQWWGFTSNWFVQVFKSTHIAGAANREFR